MAPMALEHGDHASSTNGHAEQTQLPVRPRHGPSPGENDRAKFLNHPDSSDVQIVESLYGTRKKMKVIMIGSGMSGIQFFHDAELKLKNVDIVCYEKNADVGGTWLENRYPGCACDIPSVVYQFPWRRTHWTKYYSHSPEIWKYIKMVVDENNFVEKYVKLQHRVTKLSWSEEAGQWTVSVHDLETDRTFEDTADIVIDGGGVLNKWKWPDIPGLQDFKGTLLHSAQWKQDTDIKDKKVALIGAGSSAVQILPNIYDQVSQVYTWIRSKIWITAGFAQKFAGKDGANFIYNEEQQRMFDDPDAYLKYCKMIEGELNQRFTFIINGSNAQAEAREYSENEMKTLLKDRPDLLEQIMPTDFFVACRRPTPGNGYLEALSGPKTKPYTSQLGQITSKGFIDPDGNEQEVDVIICATGFDTSYKPRVPLFVNGRDMNAEWKSRQNPPAYLSVGLAEVPNYITWGGAYCPSAHGSFYPLLQAYADYSVQCIEKMQIENIKSIRPKTKVVEHFLRHADTFLKRTAWTGPCASWFKGGSKGGKPAIYPGSRLHFLRLLETPRWEDFDIDYDMEEDMFSFFGNGFHVCERDGSDITWYFGAPKREVEEDEVMGLMDGLRGLEMRKP